MAFIPICQAFVKQFILPAFRGQFRAEWPLQSSMLRSVPRGKDLDIKTIVERVRLTELSLSTLRGKQKDLFGTELDENTLMAIAQHFGFPTPLLDFTKSPGIAAFFATLGARNLKGDEPICGVIYYLRLNEEKRIEKPGVEIDFPLLELTEVHLGELQFIEPNIPDEDNRIKRQQGFFINGFDPFALQNYIINQIFFWQQPGEVFEDPRNGIDESTLLPDHTQLTYIAESIRNDFAKNRGPGLSRSIAEIKLPQQGIIGTQGSLLRSQIEDSSKFFRKLNEILHDIAGIDGCEALTGILHKHFLEIRNEKYVGQIPVGGGTEAMDSPLFTTIKELAEWADLGLRSLWDYIVAKLDGGPGEYDSGHPTNAPEPIVKSKRQIIVFSTALFLAGWEHLRYVDGKKARRLVLEAVSVLENCN